MSTYMETKGSLVVFRCWFCRWVWRGQAIRRCCAKGLINDLRQRVAERIEQWG